MLEQGAIAEVRALLALGLDPGLPAMKAVGVRQLAAYLKGETSLDLATAAARQATRQYAKRQFTWLRHQLSGDRVVNQQYSSEIAEQALAFIRQALLTTRP
jgi:tRNA dimethylallyltransferase